MKQNNAYLKDENLLTLFSLNNLIVPEIQREYVWGRNKDVLESFLKELEQKASPCETCHHVHSNKNINVGFLYSYKPSYVKYESERILDEFLIDGQQRITTLFLLLLYRATIEDRMNDFMAICRAEENDFEMGFNYKVRSLTQQFVVQLITHAKSEGVMAFDFISDLDNCPYWFLDDYRSDPTVMAMIYALQSIQKIFGSKTNFYFDYLLTNIHFWHFKTDVTSQGEELYITMNSRGEQLTDNEMQKARKLPNDNLITYGAKWEKWQTYFWRNRKRGNSTNVNADKGFNNYLACIDCLEKFFFPQQAQDISSIETYMSALKYICNAEFRDKIHTIYAGLYTAWFDSFINLLWSEINNYNGRWDLNNPTGGNDEVRKDYNNKSVLRNKSMLFWPWMMYFKICKEKGIDVNDELLVRILHFYYIRYNCYKRSATSVETIINCFIDKDGKIHDVENNNSDDDDNANSKTFSNEEILLSELYYDDRESPSKEIESIIWETQDLPYFIDGKDVGGNTVYELFADKDIINRKDALQSITLFYERITALLAKDIKETSHITIKEILLFYTDNKNPYWNQQSPWYYRNYETSNWRRIVRTKHFQTFFKEYVSAGKNLDDFLDMKRHEFFEMEENKTIIRNGNHRSHRRLCILYDLLCESGCLWDDSHANIVFRDNSQPDSNDEIFIGQNTLWRGKRYSDGNEPIKLKPDWQTVLKDRYNVIISED